MSVYGTDKGKWKKVGRRTVKTGMDRSRFDGWGWNRFQASFVLSMIVRQVRKRIHSKETLVRLFMQTPAPYHLEVKGQSICTPSPVR